MRKLYKSSKLTWLFVFVSLSACNKYYMPVEAKNATEAETIKKSIDNGKFLILRDSLASYAMNEVQFDQKTGIIHCQLNILPIDHSLYATKANRKHIYDEKNGESGVLNEVHLFTGSSVIRDSKIVTGIPLQEIRKVEEIKFDKRRTTRNHIIIGAAITLGVAATIVTVAGIIATADMLASLSAIPIF